MGDLATGFYWMDVLNEAEKNDRYVEITLKNNDVDTFEGNVTEVSQGIVRIVDPDEEKEYGTYILLDEIVVVLVMKGHDD